MPDPNIPELTEGDKAGLQGHLDNAFSNLNAAVMQMIPADDEIICDRVRRALADVKTARSVLAQGTAHRLERDELLEALKIAQHAMRETTVPADDPGGGLRIPAFAFDHPMMQHVRAAIAKAEGRDDG